MVSRFWAAILKYFNITDPLKVNLVETLFKHYAVSKQSALLISIVKELFGFTIAGGHSS